MMTIYVWELIEFEIPNLESLLGFYHQKKKGNFQNWETIGKAK